MTIFYEADGWRDLSDEGPVYFLKEKDNWQVVSHGFRMPFYASNRKNGPKKEFKTWAIAKAYVDTYCAARERKIKLENDLWDTTLRGQKMSTTEGLTIFKYQMPVLERFKMQLPKGANIIRMDDQDGMFWLWAVVDTNAELEWRNFCAIKTGAPVPAGLKLQYLGFCKIFVQMELGLYIFEEIQ